MCVHLKKSHLHENKDECMLSATKCGLSAGTLVCGDVKLMRIFAGVSLFEKLTSNRSKVIEIDSAYLTHCFSASVKLFFA